MTKKTILVSLFLLIFSIIYANGNSFIEGEPDSLTVDYISKTIKLDRELQKDEYYGNYAYLSEKGFLKMVNSFYNQRIELLKSYPTLNKDFIHIEENRILLKKLGLMESFENMKRYITQDSSFKVSEDYPYVYNMIDLNNELFIDKIEDYKFFVLDYYSEKANIICDLDSTKDIFLTFLRLLQNDTIKPPIKETVSYQYSITYINSVDSLKSYYKLYSKIAQNRKYKNEISTKYKKLIKITKGKKSPDFKFVDINGNTVKLSDFKGKYVYIDIWATWCKPCLIEMKSLEKLKKSYPDIVYISICKKDSKGRWEKFVKNENLDGIQLFAPNEDNDFFKSYLVKGIPRFILIDKEGKILDSNAPYPSEKIINNILKNLI